MKWVLLLILFSCSTQNDQEKKEISAATESEAKPISPYTVQPCYCMKIFKPVCADGMPYGNSCEAECHGHKKWTEGPCSTPQKK